MKSLLVPIDFTSTTKNALNFAINLARKNQYVIHLLHIIRSESDRTKAKLTLDKMISDLSDMEDIRLEPTIIVGDIEDDISKIAESQKVNFIIMGTHGAQGLQKLFGAKAIQVISESKVPYITVQDQTKELECKKIAMTIDLEKESVQIVRAAGKIASEFNAEIVLVGGAHKDTGLQQKVAVNVNTTRRLLNEMGVKSSVELLPRDNFIQNFIEYCKNNEVGMIAATYYPDTFNLFSRKFVQNLLENDEGIPVLTLDSQSISVGSQYSFITI